MLTDVTYNCNPESLDEITPEAFVDAFENEVVARPQYRETRVQVTFNADKSRVTRIASDAGDDAADYADLQKYEEEFAYFAERAFRACCEQTE